MKWAQNLSIATKLLCGFVIIAFVAAGIGFVGIQNTRTVSAANEGLYQHTTIPLSLLADMGTASQRVRVNLQQALLSGDPAEVNRCLNVVNQLDADEKASAAKLDTAIASDAMRNAFQEYESASSQWSTLAQRVASLIQTGNKKAAVALMVGQGNTSARSERSSIDKMMELATAEGKATSATIQGISGKAVSTMIILILIGMAAAIGLGLCLAKMIGSRLHAISAAAEKLAVGDAGAELDATQDDEIGRLSKAFNQAIANIREQSIAAESIARGDLSIEVSARSDRDILGKSMQSMVSNIRALVADTKDLAEAAAAGEYSKRADASRHSGEYADIIQGLNQTLDGTVEKLEWYKGIIDAVPYPVHVIDKDMNWTFLNKAFEKLMVDQGYIRDRSDAVGRPCSTANANICNTEKCGIRQLHRGNTESFFDWCGMNCKQDTSHVVNIRGEKVGFVEVVQDLTPLIRVKNYTNKEVDRLSSNLVQLAKGDLSFVPKSEEADTYTVETKGQFDKINETLESVKDAVGVMATDAENLSEAAIEGQLGTRVDASKHQGAYRQIIEGINKTLDAVVGPMRAAATYMERIGKGEIPERNNDHYKGEFDALQQSVNDCIDGLNGLTEANAVLHRMAENDFTTSVEGNYQGIFADVATATNTAKARIMHTIDICHSVAKGDFAEDLKDLQKIGKRSEHDTLIPALMEMMQAIGRLAGDAEMLSQAAVEGRLEVRADLSQHQGEYRNVVKGVNDTLDAITQPLNEASDTLHRLANRDLTARVTGSYQGDFAKIKDAINMAMENLDDGLGQVATGAEQVASASVQISTGSQSLSQSASEQASSLEEISSSLQEMSSMTRQNAANAQEAKALAENTRAAADKGVASMERLSSAVDRIKSSADQTAKIVKTIDEIAFQTNLLALNAAVEAARAGDAGKGFAVVAEEVRNLAMRSAEAAKNTANLIEESVQNAEGGVGINQEVLVNLQEINQQVNRVSEVMSEIALSSEQQNQGISQVTTAVSEMDHLTQQNAANSEESASAAEELSSQAEEMQSMVASFQLSSGSRKAAPVVDRRRTDRSLSESGSRNGASRLQGKNGHSVSSKVSPATIIPFDDDDQGVLKSF